MVVVDTFIVVVIAILSFYYFLHFHFFVFIFLLFFFFNSVFYLFQSSIIIIIIIFLIFFFLCLFTLHDPYVWSMLTPNCLQRLALRCLQQVKLLLFEFRWMVGCFQLLHECHFQPKMDGQWHEWFHLYIQHLAEKLGYFDDSIEWNSLCTGNEKKKKERKKMMREKKYGFDVNIVNDISITHKLSLVKSHTKI